MKHVLLTLWVLLVGTNLLAQETGIVTGKNGNMTVISGTVCHEKTDEPIRQASVVVKVPAFRWLPTMTASLR